MDGLLTLLIFAGLIYFMMRFGCGAHMIHGRHGNHDEHGDTDAKRIDPVCGVQVAPDEGCGKMEQGRLYRFCSRRCLDKFDAAPQEFLSKPKEASA